MEKGAEERTVAIHDHLPTFAEKFADLVVKVSELHDNDKLMMAFKTLQEIECSLEYHQAMGDALKKEERKAVEQLVDQWKKHGDKIQKIKKETSEIKTLLSELQSNDGWTEVSNANGVRTLYRHESSTPVHSIKTEGIIDAPAMNMLAILNEHSLYQSWFPLIPVKVNLVKQITNFRKVLHCQARLPWPLAPREAVILGYGVDMLEEDATLIMIRDCSSDDVEPHLIPPCTRPYKRVETRVAGFLFKPLSKTSTHVTIIINGNPKFSHVPYYVINWAAKAVIKAAWAAFESKACDLTGTMFELKMLENQTVYNEMKKREEEYWERRRLCP